MNALKWTRIAGLIGCVLVSQTLLGQGQSGTQPAGQKPGTGSQATAGSKPADPAAQAQKMLTDIKAAKAKFVQDQKDLQRKLKDATKDQKNKIRAEIQDKRDKFLEQQKEMREEFRQRVNELKDLLKDHQDLIDNAKEKAKGSTNGRKGGDI